METHTILDDDKDPVDIQVLIKNQKRKYLIRASILTLINIALYIFVLPQRITGNDNIQTALMGQGIGFPMLSFILGVPATLIPYKNLSYGEKYVRTSLLILYIMAAIMSVMLMINVLGTLNGII